MPRVFIIPPLFLLLFLTGISPATAYWLENKTEPFTIHGARETAPPSLKKGIFTVQDNLDLFTRRDGTSPIILPHSDYFIAADIINANLPIFGIFSHPTKPAGDPIANLIYANLKLKKLVEEYTNLQEKARKLLNHQYSIVPASKMQTVYTIPLHQELNRLTTRIASINTAELTYEHVQDDTSTPNFETRKSLVSFQYLRRRQEMKHQGTGLALNHSFTTKQPYSSKVNNFSSQNQAQQSTPSEKTAHNNSFAGSREITIPLILHLPSIMLKYFLTHKFEALFFSFLILMLVSAIFGSRL